MFKLTFTHLATGKSVSEVFSSVIALVEREEELSKVTHWSGGKAYGFFLMSAV